MRKSDLRRFTTWPVPRNPSISPQRARGAWAGHVRAEEAYRRAGARRRWNLKRRGLADARRLKLIPFLQDPERNGAELARRLGVHRSTVCRDFVILRAKGVEAEMGRCNLRNLIRAIGRIGNA